MKKILFILCTPLFLLAQTDGNKHSIEWNTNLLFESSSLDKSFLNTMLYGGYITDSMKSKWINAGGDNNVLYSEISNGLSYTYRFKKKSIGFQFADRNILNASFTDDLLRLGFEGNFNYQNETLDFSNTNIRADRFQQYKLDYTLNFNTTSITIGGSFLAGNHHASFIVNNGSLFTDTNGIRLDANYDIHSFVTDTSSFDPFARNGSGLAFDFSADFSIRNHKVNIYLQDRLNRYFFY